MTPEAILTLFEKNGDRLSARNLATAVHRIAKHGGRRVMWDPRLERLLEMCGRRIGEFKPQEIANSAWGCAKAGFTNQPLFKAVAAEVPRRIREFNAQEMANTVWAFACVGWEQHQIFREFGSSIVTRLDDFNEVERSQLYLVALFMQVQWPARDCPLSPSLQSFRSAYTSCMASPTQLQCDVSTMLRQMGWNHSFKHETAEGFSLDLAQPESKLAVEVDGPSHFLKNLPSEENVVNGATIFKTRQLRSFGWTVAHISFFDWDNKSESERRKLVIAKLGELGVPVEDAS